MGKAGKERRRAFNEAHAHARTIMEYGTEEEKNATVADIASIAESIREIEAMNVKLATATVANVIAIAKFLGGVRPNFKHGQWGGDSRVGNLSDAGVAKG